MYEIRYIKEAIKTLRKLPRNTRELIEQKLQEFAENPASGRNVLKLEGRPGYRMRVGDWRIVFDIDNGALIVLVLKIAPRGEAYKS